MSKSLLRYLLMILYLLKKMKISRGLRNNNPLNIRRNATKWKGLAAVQSDKEFFMFTEACWGYRAAFITLRNYRLRHGLKSLRQWISRWAPPVENDTEAYIRFVSSKTGIDAGKEVRLNDPDEMMAVVSAMSYIENGIPANEQDVVRGWNLALSL